MNRTVLIVGIIIVVAIAAFMYFTPGMQQGSTATSTAETTSSTGASTAPKLNNNTFKSIFANTADSQCDYDQAGDTSHASNVIYIADGKMRGEFRTSLDNGTSINSLMVYVGGYLYSWQEGKTTGKKSAISSIKDLPEAIPVDLNSGAILGNSDTNVSWDCHPWIKDAKILTVPTYVTFSAK